MNPWFNRMAAISLVGLLFLCLAWELWLAPLRPGGSMLALKALPLLLPLFGILRGNRYTHQWTSMLALAYLTEGLVRATSDQGTSQMMAVAETVLATLLFAGCLGHAGPIALTEPGFTIDPERGEAPFEIQAADVEVLWSGEPPEAGAPSGTERFICQPAVV